VEIECVKCVCVADAPVSANILTSKESSVILANVVHKLILINDVNYRKNLLSWKKFLLNDKREESRWMINPWRKRQYYTVRIR
jgi:hypothetical protein